MQQRILVPHARNTLSCQFMLTLSSGDEISVADLFAVAEVMQPWGAGFDISTTRPRIAAWIDDVKSETQPHYDDSRVYIKQVSETAGVGIQKALKAFLAEQQETKSAATQ